MKRNRPESIAFEATWVTEDSVRLDYTETYPKGEPFDLFERDAARCAAVGLQCEKEGSVVHVTGSVPWALVRRVTRRCGDRTFAETVIHFLHYVVEEEGALEAMST